MTKRNKVGLACLIFVIWMVVQFVRSATGGEPYPAIKYPGFPGKGNKQISSRELYQISSNEERLITHYESALGHPRYRRLLQDLCVAIDENDLEALELHKNGLKDIRGLEKGDTLEIIDKKWKANKKGYAENSRKSRRFVL